MNVDMIVNRNSHVPMSPASPPAGGAVVVVLDGTVAVVDELDVEVVLATVAVVELLEPPGMVVVVVVALGVSQVCVPSRRQVFSTAALQARAIGVPPGPKRPPPKPTQLSWHAAIWAAHADVHAARDAPKAVPGPVAATTNEIQRMWFMLRSSLPAS